MKLDVLLVTACSVAISDDVEGLIEVRRPRVAFSLGAMGSAQTNFYNDAFRRAGFADEARAIQALWLDGKRKEAADLVPDALITQFGAIGTPEMVKQRLVDAKASSFLQAQELISAQVFHEVRNALSAVPCRRLPSR